MAWLRSSTHPDAQRVRGFLNSNLAALPTGCGRALCHRFGADPWRHVFFELVVGRFLQVLGASVEHEPVGDGGLKVDYRAAFAGGEAVHVEATSPAYNQDVAEQLARANRMVAVVEQEAPAGWSVAVCELPAIGPADSLRAFRREVRRMFAPITPASTAAELMLRGAVAQGAIRLDLFPGPHGDHKVVATPGVSYADDSDLRIARSVRGKRRQARAFPGPLLLAVDAPGGVGLDDFDVALFGRTVEYRDVHTEVTGHGFDPSGVFLRQRQAECAGVLAFMNLGVFGGSDPILYLHPKFHGSLPAELRSLATRTFDGAAISSAPAARAQIINALGFRGPDE